MIFKVAIEKHFIRYEIKNYSKRTIKTQRFTVQKFIDWLYDNYGLLDSQLIRRFHLLRYQEYLCIQKHYSPSYVNQRISSINAFLKFLKREGEILGELCEVLEHVKEPQRLPKVISLEQFDALLASIDMSTIWGKRDFVIISLFLSSGIRVEEMHRLNVGDIDLKENTGKVLGKGNKERLSVFGENCSELLRVYLSAIRPLLPNRQREEALFLSKKSNRLSVSSIQKVVKKYAEKAGIEELSCHTFRRTFCTELIKAGGNLYHISRMMGHASLEHLSKYTFLDVASLQETHERCHPRG